MIIQTLGKKYVVIKYCSSNSRMERFLCKEESDGRCYTVIRMKDRDWITKTMEFLIREMENESFTDLSCCFAGEEYFHVVLAYTEGISLQEKLDNEICSLEERLAVGRHLLERIMLLDMSDYFLQECLNPAHIVVSPDLDVAFTYELNTIFQYDRFGFEQVRRRLLQVMEILFEGELKKKMLPPLNHFCDMLQKAEWKDVVEIFRQYREMYQKVLSMAPEEMELPNTRIFRVWERLRRLIVPLKKIMALLLLMFAVLYLIYTVQKSVETSAEKKAFDSIGTLEIRD